MIETLGILLLTLACIGGGSMLLHALGLWRDRPAVERTALAFAVGFGAVGWLFFWIGTVGVLSPAVTWAVCLGLAAGNMLHKVPARHTARDWSGSTVWALSMLAVAAFFLDFLEAAAPPVDADTLAYHFVLARQFATEGQVVFVPQALSGAIPLLVHMTYAVVRVLGAGGDFAFTGWSLISGWMASVLLFGLALRWLSVPWALTVALMFQTLPAMIYGAGTGQVEARLALFVLVATVGIVESWRTQDMRPVILIGLGAGFFMGGKYTGLFFAAAAGLALLATGRPWFKHAAIYSATALIAGGQWYGWNFIHTGDPVFPFLFDLADKLGLANDAIWDAGHASDLGRQLDMRGEVTDAFHWWLTYPILATLAPPSEIESGRIGLGPFFLLVAPFSLLGLWQKRDRITKSPLLPVAIMVIGFYLLWMGFGNILKVRHLLPLIPPLLLCLMVSSLSAELGSTRRPVALAAFLSLAINFAAQGIFSRAYVVYHFSGQSQEEFLAGNLFGYPQVAYINRLSGVSGVYLWDRQLRYYLRSASFFSAPFLQGLIDGRPGHVVPERFFRQLRAQGNSHLTLPMTDRKPPAGTIRAAILALEARGCLIRQGSVSYRRFASRTLQKLASRKVTAKIWRVVPGCPI